jgi:L-xylulokinase
MLHAVYEGVCFAQRIHFERLLRFRPAPVSVRLSGGAARSIYWCQMYSDTLGLPLEIPQGEELGAKGAAIAAAIVAGIFPGYEEAVRAMTSIERRYQPKPQTARILRSRFERYARIVAGLSEIWPLLDRAKEDSL